MQLCEEGIPQSRDCLGESFILNHHSPHFFVWLNLQICVLICTWDQMGRMHRSTQGGTEPSPILTASLQWRSCMLWHRGRKAGGVWLAHVPGAWHAACGGRAPGTVGCVWRISRAAATMVFLPDGALPCPPLSSASASL